MAKQKELSPQDQLDAFIALPLPAQLQHFEAIRTILRDKKAAAEQDLQSLKSANIEQNGQH